jgi:hypothetical protein
VLCIAPRLGTAAGERALERLALEPRIWLGMRRLDALGLGVCAALLAALLGTASAGAAPIVGATDPSVDGAVLAWQRVGGNGVLRTSSGTVAVAGTLPAVGGFNKAWLTPAAIAVQLRQQPPLTLPLPPNSQVDALAISGSWLVVRDEAATGIANLFAVSLPALAQGRYVATYIRGSGTPGAIGRPTIEGTLVAYAYSTPAGSSIAAIDLASGARTVLRSATSEVQFESPALGGGHLLYERSDRCAQELLLGGTYSSSGDRVLLTLPSTVARDPGWQGGYQHAWNSASGCPNRRAGAGGTITLGSTALGSADAYVSESPPNLAQTSIVTVPLG